MQSATAHLLVASLLPLFVHAGFAAHSSPQIPTSTPVVAVAQGTLYDIQLASYLGTIFLLDPKADAAYSSELQAACGSAMDTELCYREFIVGVGQQQGEKDAFGMLANLSNNHYDLFLTVCDPILSAMGADAYRRFVDTGEVYSTIQTKYCRYAFFRGMIEEMRARNGPTNTLALYCDKFNSELSPQESLLSACVHGFGQAAVFEARGFRPGASPNDWLAMAMALCDGFTDPNALAQCTGGTVNSIASLFFSGESPFDPVHPLAFCDEQTYDVRYHCYEMFKYLLWRAGDDDIVKSAAFFDHGDDTTAQAGMYNLASLAIRDSLAAGEDDSPLLQECRSVPERLVQSCITGAVAGLMAHGVPGTEYVRAVAFCDLPQMSKEDRAACDKQVLWMSSLRYDKALYGSIAASLAAHGYTGSN